MYLVGLLLFPTLPCVSQGATFSFKRNCLAVMFVRREQHANIHENASNCRAKYLQSLGVFAEAFGNNVLLNFTDFTLSALNGFSLNQKSALSWKTTIQASLYRQQAQTLLPLNLRMNKHIFLRKLLFWGRNWAITP